jgi:hypothetical protein
MNGLRSLSGRRCAATASRRLPVSTGAAVSLLAPHCWRRTAGAALLAPHCWRRSSDQRCALASCRHHSTTAMGRAPPSFVEFSVYKGRAAMQIKPIPPSWRSSGSSGARAIEREGVILVEAAPAHTLRQYDWSRKVTFALNILEIGKLLARSSGQAEVNFVHDPNKGRQGEGSTIKTFKLTRMSTDCTSAGWLTNTDPAHRQLCD